VKTKQSCHLDLQRQEAVGGGFSSQSKHPDHQIQAACTIGQSLLSYRVNIYSSISLFHSFKILCFRRKRNLLGYMRKIITSDNTWILHWLSV